VFKIINGLAPEYLQDKVVLKEHNSQRMELRSSYDFSLLDLPVQHRDTCHYKMAEHWNTLPIIIRDSGTLKMFCSHLKTHLFQLAYE